MIRVREDDLGACSILTKGFQRLLRNGFDAGSGSHGHKHGCLHRAMRQVQRGPARIASSAVQVETK